MSPQIRFEGILVNRTWRGKPGGGTVSQNTFIDNLADKIVKLLKFGCNITSKGYVRPPPYDLICLLATRQFHIKKIIRG